MLCTITKAMDYLRSQGVRAPWAGPREAGSRAPGPASALRNQAARLPPNPSRSSWACVISDARSLHPEARSDLNSLGPITASVHFGLDGGVLLCPTPTAQEAGDEMTVRAEIAAL